MAELKNKLRTSTRKRHGRSSIGGVFKCLQCHQMADYGAECGMCNQRYHADCMLSMRAGKQHVCVKCFQRTNLPDSSLDDHMTLPESLSPAGEVPFHAFTRNYSAKRKLLQEVLFLVVCLLACSYFSCIMCIVHLHG